MLGLIKKDLILAKSNLKLYILLIAMYAIMAYTSDFSISVLFPLFSMLTFLMTFSYDEYNGWMAYSTALPGGRKNYVKSKYITYLIFAIIYAVLGSGILYGLSKIKEDISFTTNLEMMFGSYVGIIIMVIILFPLIFKYGVQKSRIILFIIVGAIAAGIALLGTMSDSSTIILENLGNILNKYGIYFVIIGVPVFTAISYLLSSKIYMKKEF